MRILVNFVSHRDLFRIGQIKLIVLIINKLRFILLVLVLKLQVWQTV